MLDVRLFKTKNKVFNYQKMNRFKSVQFSNNDGRVCIMFSEILFDLLLLCWHFLRDCASSLPDFNRNYVSCCLDVSYEGRRRKVARIYLTLFHFMITKFKDLSIKIIARRIFQVYSQFCILVPFWNYSSLRKIFKIVLRFCRLKKGSKI